MAVSRVIRVDEEVYRALQTIALPSEKWPNSVLRRLLALPDNASTQPKRRRGADRTPQEAFRRPILETIEELGGKGRVAEVLERMERKMARKFTKVDFSKVKTGIPRWQVYARWQRLRMVHEGLLRGEHGYWEITEEGRTSLKRQDG